MAHEACTGTGNKAWTNSVLVSHQTGTIVADGSLEVELKDPSHPETGELKGRHSSGDPLMGTCTPLIGQLSNIMLTRRNANGSLTYTGTSVPISGGHLIFRGSYVQLTNVTVVGETGANEDILVASDSGDWTAQKPGD